MSASWPRPWGRFNSRSRVSAVRPVQIRRRIPVPPEQLDTAPRTWGPAEELRVLAMAPGSQEPAIAGREAVDVTWTLYCPTGTRASGLDIVIIDGIEHEVIGDARDWGVGVVIETRHRAG